MLMRGTLDLRYVNGRGIGGCDVGDCEFTISWCTIVSAICGEGKRFMIVGELQGRYLR